MPTEKAGGLLLSILNQRRAAQEADAEEEANRPEAYPGEAIVRVVESGRMTFGQIVLLSFNLKCLGG
jgi:hypothetical protein